MKRSYIKAGLLGLALACSVALMGATSSCSQSADVVSQNLSLEADNFRINRKVTFYNGITGETFLVLTGLCSKGNDDTEKVATFTCQTGPSAYKKTFLGLSDNVTYMIEQIDAVASDPYHYEVIWRPSTIIPDIRIE